MGIRLVMESASRHAPEGLTWRERYSLIVLAASAIDATRELPPGIEDNPEIIARLRLGRSERYAVFASLVTKGALERLERGRNGVKAVYAIAAFDSATEAARPGDPDAHPVDNPAEGSGEPGCFSSGKGPGSATEGSGFDPSKGPGTPDPAPYKGIRDFKTGGTPLPPGIHLLSQFALPEAPPEEGDCPTAKNSAANGTARERHALAAEITKIRPEWSKRSVLRALERPSVAERPWLIVAEAMRLMAADPNTQHPGRLEHDGPWWAEAARRCRRPAEVEPPEGGVHKFDPDGNGDCRRCPLPADSRYHSNRKVS
jgi:hypothetical protein